MQKNIALFVKNNKKTLNAAACYAGTALFVATLFFAALFVFNAYPFSQTYISSYDLNAQITPFIEHLFDVFSGKSSLFYTYSLAGGMDMFGSLVYCLISPFTFIYLFFGSGRVCYGTSFVLPLKLVCICVSALFYLRRNFKEIPDFLKCALSICYAYCGYLFVANTYINWLDLLIYMPFLAHGLKNLVENGKKRGFVIPLALMLYTSFSITAFSLFIIFPLLIAYVLLMFPKKEYPREKRIKITSDICFSLVLAIALALPLMLPSLVAFTSSGRRGGIFENLFGDISVSPLYAKFSYILTDSFALCLTLYYFVKNGIENKKAKFLGFAFVITLLPVLCDECMLLLNLGSYMSYALRFGFLNGFYFFYVAACALSEIYAKKADFVAQSNVISAEKCENRESDNVNNDSENCENNEINPPIKDKKSFFSRIFSKKTAYISALAVVCAGVIVGWYFLYLGVKSEVYVKYFASRFAHSLGGLEVTCLLFAGVLCAFAVGFPFIIKGKLSKKPLAIACAVLLVCQVGFYDYALVKGNSNDYTNLAEIGGITDAIGENGDGYGRIKLAGDYVSADAPLTLHTNSFSVFSSMADEKNFAPINFFKYGNNGKNVMRSYNGTLLGDCLLGFEYYITKNTAYLPCYDDNPAYESINGTYKAYKNNWVFPHAFKVESSDMGMLENGDAEDYKKLLNVLGVEDGVFEYELTYSRITVQDKESGAWRVLFKYEVEGNMFIKCSLPEGVELEYCVGSWKDDSVKTLTGEQIFKAGHGKGYGYSLHVRLKKGEELEKDDLLDWFSSFIVSDSAVRSASEKATKNAAEIELAPNVITATVSSTEGEYLLLNYIALDGHTVYVNGKKTELIQNGLNFMLLKLDAGENEVKIVYCSPYITYAIIGAVLGLILILAVLAFYKFKNLSSMQKFSGTTLTSIYYAALGLAILILAFFFAFPLILMLYKAIKSSVLSIIKLFVK